MNKDEKLKRVGEFVKEKRKGKGWSQEVLAEKAGLSKSAIGMIERGSDRMRMSQMIAVFYALGFEMGIGFRTPREMVVEYDS